MNTAQTTAQNPDQFQRFDIVELRWRDTAAKVIFTEDPEICKPDDEICLIIEHAHDGNLVGSFMPLSEVMASAPRLQTRIGPAADRLAPRLRALQDAGELIDGDRNVSYGTPMQNFSNIAAFWSVQFGQLLRPGARFTSAHIAQANALQKLARMIAQPKGDNWIDLAGYAACGFECDEQA